MDSNALRNLTLEDVWERGTAFGTPERVTEVLKMYMHKLGVGNFIIQMRIGGLQHDKVMRSMDLFAAEVMPALRKESELMMAAE